MNKGKEYRIKTRSLRIIGKEELGKKERNETIDEDRQKKQRKKVETEVDVNIFSSFSFSS